MWAPWRMEYIKGEKTSGCIFCSALKAYKDKENLILLRGKHSSVMLNKYPYSNGHIMVFPHEHVADIALLDTKGLVDTFSTLRDSVALLKKAISPEGFNIGINMGKCAGAGIKDHIHIHVVPRWEGDTNFMPLIGEVKLINEHLSSTYEHLSHFFIE